MLVRDQAYDSLSHCAISVHALIRFDSTFLINIDQFTALELIMYNLFILTFYQIFQ